MKLQSDHLDFESTDIGEVEAYVSAHYSTMRVGAPNGQTRATISRRLLGDAVEFHDLAHSFDIGYDAEPAGRLIVCDVVSSTVERGADSASAADVFGPGEQFLVSRPGLPYSGVTLAARLRNTLIDPGLLAAAAAGGADSAGAEQVRLLSHRPVSLRARLRMQRAITYVRDETTGLSDGPAAPLLVSTAGQYLAAQILHTYPNTAVRAERAIDRRDALPSALSRAVSFIETAPDLPLTLADMAAAAYVTPRALQLAFRSHLGTTPMAYLRRVRLQLAREDLADADPAATTVAAVAARWGFSGSRFTAHYRSAFGELPSQTLHG